MNIHSIHTQRPIIATRRSSTLIALSFSLLFAHSNLGFAQVKKGKLNQSRGEIRAVTVLSDRAEITRVMKVKCDQAKRGITASFSGLPQMLQVKTLRAEIKGPASLVGVSHHPTSTVNTGTLLGETYMKGEKAEGAIKSLEEIRGKREAERERLNSALSRLSQESQVLSEAVGQGLRLGRLDFKVLMKSLDRIAEERRVIHTRLAKLKHEASNNERELASLKRFIQAAQHTMKLAHRAEGGEAIVSMTCRSMGTIKIALSYVTASASWSLDYNANISERSARRGEVKLGVNAIVRQATGENWRNVKLTLSTAQPNLGDRAPLPKSLHISAQKKRALKVLSQRSEDRSQLQSGGSHGSSNTGRIKIEDRGQSFGLKVPTKVTIESHGQAYWVPISLSTTKAKLRLVSTPKLSSHVFKVARFNNPAPHPLPQGMVSISYRGEYLGKVTTKHYGIGAPIELTLGVEEGLRISRTLDEGKDKEPGLLEDEKHLQRRFKISLRSSVKRIQRVEVTDQIPISEIEHIKVSLDKDKTSKAYQLNTKTGLVTWDIKVKSLAKFALYLAYEVRIPEDMKLR
jgi:uncharacterized protein (TIGR02231 family)